MWKAINMTTDSSKVTLVCDDYNDGEILQLDKSQLKCKVHEEEMYQNLTFLERMCDFDVKKTNSVNLRTISMEDLHVQNKEG